MTTAAERRQLDKLHGELATLEARRRELCYLIAGIYADGGRTEESFDAAYELWSESFQPLLADIEHLELQLRRLTPQPPRRRVDGRLYPRARRVR